MSSASKAWGVAASIGAVEALKDQLGFCRWNHLIRSAQQYARNNGRAISRVSSSGDDDGLHYKNTIRSSSRSVRKLYRGDRGNRAEESLKTIMYLSSWGPYN
ncbi:hypothetical protein LINPERPRIM_LOCUS1922 [Linum perenne]